MEKNIIGLEYFLKKKFIFLTAQCTCTCDAAHFFVKETCWQVQLINIIKYLWEKCDGSCQEFSSIEKQEFEKKQTLLKSLKIV